MKDNELNEFRHQLHCKLQTAPHIDPARAVFRLRLRGRERQATKKPRIKAVSCRIAN